MSADLEVWVTRRGPWGQVVKFRVMCEDGRVRNTCWVSVAPDTFFSHPAAVRIRGRYARGFVHVKDGRFHFTERV